jgi:hypothetical protein
MRDLRHPQDTELFQGYGHICMGKLYAILPAAANVIILQWY